VSKRATEKCGRLIHKEGQNAKWFLIFKGIAPVIALKNENRLTIKTTE